MEATAAPGSEQGRGVGELEAGIGAALLPRVCSGSAKRQVLAALCPYEAGSSGHLLGLAISIPPTFPSKCLWSSRA